MTTRNLVIALKLTADGKVASGQVNDLEKNVDRLGDTAEKTGKRTRQTARDIDRMGRDSAQAAGGLKGLWRELMSVRSIVGTVGVAITGLGITRLGSSFLGVARETEQLQVRLKVLLGSVSEGNRLFQNMAEFAGRVPFQYGEIMTAATQLAGVMSGGVDQIGEWMPLIADLAAATGLGIQVTTEQVTRMFSAGAASADLFRERGVLAMLGFQAGVSYTAEQTREQLMAQWKRMDSQFRGATDELAKTWDGTMSMFGDLWREMRQQVMDAGLFDALKGQAKDLLIELQALRAQGDIAEWAKTISAVVRGTASALASLIKVAAAGATMWAGYQVGVAVFAALEVAAWRAAAAATGHAAAVQASTLAAVRSFGLLKSAGVAALSAFAGWEIGSWLREQFVEARLAGLAFVRQVLVGWEHLQFGIDSVMAGVQSVWGRAMAAMRGQFAEWISGIADLIDGLPVVGNWADDLREVASSMRVEAAGGADELRAKLAELLNVRDADIAVIDEEVNALVDYEIQTALGTAATEASTAAKKKHAGATADSRDVIRELIAEMEQEQMLAGLGARERSIMTEVLKAEAAARKAGLELLPQERAEIARLAAGIYDTGEAMKGATKDASEFEKELERIAARQFDDAKKFTLSLGLALDDDDIKDLTKAFEGIDAIAGMFDGIGDSGEAAIQKIAQASKSFAAAAKADGDEAFGVYLRGSAQAVAGVQQFAESGSQAYKRLGVVVSALNTVSAIQAILNQGAGDPYTAFFRMAAMAAAVGSLGIQVGGAFGGVSAAGPSRLQQTQGTGTVLGDPEAKSESILNAVEISAEAAEQLVGINTEMLRSLRTLEGAVGNVGGLVLRTGEINTGLGVKEGASGEFGYGLDLSFDGSNSLAVQMFRGVQGTLDAIFGDDFGFLDDLFGKVFSEVAKLVGGKTKILDEGIRIVGGAIADLTGAVMAEAFVDFKVKKNFLDDYDRKRNTQPLSDEVTRQFQLIFEGIVDSTFAAATALGLDEQLVRDRLAAFELDDIEISSRDLSGDALADEISAVFSAVFDDVAEAIVPMITEFQRVGEGAAETLVRVATNVEAVRRQFETLDINLPATGVLGQAAAATAIVDATGGLEGFFGLTNDYMELVLTETERMDALRGNVGRALESLLGEGAAGLVPTSREELQALISGFEVVDEASAATFASLLSLVPAFEELIDFTDKQTEATLKLSQAYEQAIANIGRTRTDLTRSALSPAAQVSDTLAEFQSLATRAGNAEGEELVALADELNRLGVDLVALSRQTFASGGQTPQILALVDSVLADLQERLGDAQESLDYEAESVNLLQQIRDLIAQQNQLNAQAASGVILPVEPPPAKPGVGAPGVEVPPPSTTQSQEIAAQQPLIIEVRGEDSRLIRRQFIADMRRESRNGRILIDSRGVGRVE